MIAIDTNILVYGHRKDAGMHKAALRCMRDLITSGQGWAIPWPCAHEFFAIVTHPRIYKPPTPASLAIEQIQTWLDLPGVIPIGETTVHWSALSSLARSGQIAGPQVHDARIAAICLQHGVTELWTVDRDFSRFPSLKRRNPLVP